MRSIRPQSGFDHPATTLLLQQAVVGAVQGDEAEGLEVTVEQVAETAALAQPNVSGTFGSRVRHAPDQQVQGGLALRQGQAQPGQQGRQAELAGGPQGGVFDAHRARAATLREATSTHSRNRVPGGRAVRVWRWPSWTPACSRRATMR